MIIGDDDDNTGVAYRLAWNGGMQNYDNTSSFGDCNLGELSCGCISLYNETTGDVVLRNPTDEPSKYVGTYNVDAGYDMMFRKDMQSTVSWADTEFPSGVAMIGGDPIPVTTGKYRVEFDCISGEYTFVVDEDQTAMADYTGTPPTIDGDLSEFSLDYGQDAGNVTGEETPNNTMTWGTLWDENYLYIGVKVVDAVVEWNNEGSPWENDAVEMYIDGNHDEDGAYDADFDSQLIQDVNEATALWTKADGYPVTDFESIYTPTGDGYTVELKLGWADFGFHPGKGRSIGWSIGNNDSDNAAGRDYQTQWVGDANNWSDTKVLGDLELVGGPYFFGIGDVEFYNDFIDLYPNPATNSVYLRTSGDVFGDQVTIMVSDMSGRTSMMWTESLNSSQTTISMDVSQFARGMYFINIVGNDGQRAVKKLIVQ